MPLKYTNNYIIMKDIIKIEYTFILTLLFNDFNGIIHLLKEKMPFNGEILENLYLSMPSYYNNTHDRICKEFTYIDSILRIIYKDNIVAINNCLKNDVAIISDMFHIKGNDFQYYYFIALLIASMERDINIDAANLYSQFKDDLKELFIDIESKFFKILNITEYQCLFYNHLEDVYKSNLSSDRMISFIHKDNYSYFLDNKSAINYMYSYLKPIEQKRYPILISNKYIYNIIDDKVNILCENNIDSIIVKHNDIICAASYYYKKKIISDIILFFNYFKYYHEDSIHNIDFIKIKKDKIDYIIDNNDITKSQEFILFKDANDTAINYYISNFTVYQNLK